MSSYCLTKIFTLILANIIIIITTHHNNKNPNPLIRKLKSIAVRETETFLGKPSKEIKKLNVLDHELGRGQFGITYTCNENLTWKTYACKSILKKKLSRKQDIVSRSEALTRIDSRCASCDGNECCADSPFPWEGCNVNSSLRILACYQ